MSHWAVKDGWYRGSQLLQPIAATAGVQVDKFNYIAAGFSSILIGTFYRTWLHPKRVTPLARKLFASLIGLVVLSFCFGGDVKHVIFQTGISYLLVLYCPIEVLPKVTLFFSLLYQSVFHAIRMYHDYEGYTLDITGALMMLTQRLTSLAFSFRDGQISEKCKPYMLKDAIKERPDLITYFAYAFDFHTVLCGPLVPFREFEAVVDGTVFNQRNNHTIDKIPDRNNVSAEEVTASAAPPAEAGSGMDHEPDPTPYVLKRTLFSLLSVIVVMFVVPRFPMEFLFSAEFQKLWLPVKIFWYFVYTALTRQQYYVIWKMAEAICNSSNFGYRFVKGKDDWGGCTNIEVWKVETAISQRDGLAAWNTSTQRWLRSICYDRLTSNKTLMTFLLSAAWHGFYPGYYLTFMTLAVQTIAARNVRRSIRPYFQHSPSMQRLWDVITFFATLCGFAYATLPFIVLSFGKAISLWTEVYFYGHVFSLFAILVLPKILPPKMNDETSSNVGPVNSHIAKQG